MEKSKINSRLTDCLCFISLTVFLWIPFGCGKADPVSENAGQQPGTTADRHVIPDKTGMTIKGMVTCNGAGVEGVEVSDGIEVATTDSKGIYYLPSKKKYGYVFISIPSGYEVDTKGNTPLFFQKVNKYKPANIEQKEFELKKVANNKHAVLAMADFHLAKRNRDLEQFRSMTEDINSSIAELKNQGYKVYGLSLGDETWDLYWYSNNFSIAEAFRQTENIDCPFFHCMGNHDNDPYYADDWLAEQTFLENFPVYYSFNLGNVHYVVLDDIEYLNTGGSIGKIGERNYNAKIIGEEINWLKKDLALIKDTHQPLVLAMHAPLYRHPYLLNGKQRNNYRLDNGGELVSILGNFSNVHLLTGHTHNNYNVAKLANLHEHNIAAICATWWWTGKLTNNKQHLCSDGTPGGYGVYLFDNGNLAWYYKSKGFDKNYQFRTYDLNTARIANDINNRLDVRKYLHGYDKASNKNEVLINVWNFDKDWNIEVKENGKALQVRRIEAYDPLHILSYGYLRLKDGHTPTSDFQAQSTAHMFKVRASQPTSTLEIKVTDCFGNIYRETMSRPKAFDLSIK